MNSLRILAPLGIALLSGIAQAAPVQLITNGGFETGNLSGWSTSGLGTTGTCPIAGRDWNVSQLPSATGCSAPGAPVSGTFAAYVMNDGFANTTYTLSQSFIVPSSVTSATLSWIDSSVSSYSGSSRLLSVDLLEGATLLANIYTYVVPLSDSNRAWDSHVFDVTSLLSANVGDTLTLRFSNFIPATWRGPAGLGLDDVSLTAVPEPGTLALLGLGVAGLAATRKRKQ